MDPSAPLPLPAPPPGALDAPAARRNAHFLLQVLQAELGADGTVLEAGAGTGQHAALFAGALHPRLWLPTEIDDARLDSIRAWRASLPSSTPRPLAPRRLDIAAAPGTWPLEDQAPFAGMLSVNVIHIAPWTVATGLFAGAARWLDHGAPLLLYGPFHRDGEPTSQGNRTFDAELRANDPAWGIRDLEREVVPAAAAAGLRLARVHDMPANNLTVVFRA